MIFLQPPPGFDGSMSMSQISDGVVERARSETLQGFEIPLARPKSMKSTKASTIEAVPEGISINKDGKGKLPDGYMDALSGRNASVPR